MSRWIGIPVLPWENLSNLAIAILEAAGDSADLFADYRLVRIATKWLYVMQEND